MKTVEIKIDPPLIGHGGAVTVVKIREPRFNDYLELGDVATVAQGPDGAAIFVENVEAIKKYIERCVVEPDVGILSQGGFQLARKLKDVMLGFFFPAEPATEGIATSPTTSLSAASAASASAPSVN